MDQPYLFPTPSGDTTSENYRPTTVYRVPGTEERDDDYRPMHNNPGPNPGGLTTNRLLFHLLLFALTIVTTTVMGGLWIRSFKAGLIYSFTVLTILTAHEMGHYIACRWHGVEATLPYFIPMPFPPVGTFGAFIKMKSPILTRRALFDIGIAGPIAGYVFAIPAAFIGHYFAKAPETFIGEGEGLIIHDPLLFKIFQHALHLPSMIELNPVIWAAWIGVFMTSLNLLPVGQLDGGHVAYAVLGKRGHQIVGRLAYGTVIALAIYSIYNETWNYVVYAGLLTFIMRFGHPPVIDDRNPIGIARILVALIGVLIFILSFLPVPISF
jgi:membrane-associated protease RseP (regulator of RpoE activity)